jgi:hypothetical protein
MKDKQTDIYEKLYISAKDGLAVSGTDSKNQNLILYWENVVYFLIKQTQIGKES